MKDGNEETLHLPSMGTARQRLVEAALCHHDGTARAVRGALLVPVEGERWVRFCRVVTSVQKAWPAGRLDSQKFPGRQCETAPKGSVGEALLTKPLR